MSIPRAFVGLLVPILAACQTPPRSDALEAPPERWIADRAAGDGVAIEFRETPEPDDADARPGDAARLTAADAVREALLHDPRLQQALARWRLALARSDEARLVPNPLLSVALTLARPFSGSMVEVGLSREIAAYFERPHRAAAADARLHAAAFDALTAALDVVAETRTAYVAAQDADARRPALEARRDVLVRLRDVHRSGAEQGEVAASDALAFDAERASVALELAELDADRARSQVELARLIGRPSDLRRRTLDAWPTLAAPLAGTSAPGALPETESVRAELEAITAERALVGTWRTEGASAGAALGWDEGLEAGPSIAIPLPLSDPSVARLAALAAQTSELGHRITELRRAAIRDLRLARADEDAARAALALLDGDLLPLLDRRRAAAEATWRGGESSIVPLLLADQALADARARRIGLERRVLDARIRLERAAGGPGTAPELPLGPQPAEPEGSPR